MGRAILILSNPNAGRGPKFVRGAVARLRAALDVDPSTRWDVTSWETDFRGVPRRDEACLVGEWLAAWEGQGAVGTPRILIVSGDGGVAKAVLSLRDRPDLRQRVEFGILPVGNANVLAREIGLAVGDLDAVVGQLQGSEPRPFDVGTLDGEPRFLLMLDVGYFAQVVEWVHRIRSSRLTRWTYAWAGDLVYGAAGMLELLRLWPARFDLRVGSAGASTSASPPVSGVALAIANVALYAKRFSLCPGADPSDGRLSFHLLPAVRSTPSFLHQAVTRQSNPNGGRTVRGEGTEFELTARRRAFRCQVDGDPLAGGPRSRLRVGIVPGFFRVLVPGEVVPTAAGR